MGCGESGIGYVTLHDRLLGCVPAYLLPECLCLHLQRFCPISCWTLYSFVLCCCAEMNYNAATEDEPAGEVLLRGPQLFSGYYKQVRPHAPG